MTSIFYCILLTLCVYFIPVSSDETICELRNQIDVPLKNGHTWRIHESTMNFHYDVHLEEVTNRTTISINNVTFKASVTHEPKKPSLKTTVKFMTLKKIRTSRDIVRQDSNNERQYCSIVLVKEPDERVGLPEEVENEIRKLILPCIQSKLCNPFTKKTIDVVQKEPKYRNDTKIYNEKLQNTVNVISDFILSKLANALTHKNVTIPRFGGNFTYPIINTVVYYEALHGFFYNPVKVDRLMDTRVVEVNNKVEIDVAYQLRDINTNFLFQLSDRSYPGLIDVNFTKLIIVAKISFDYVTCNTTLQQLRLINTGDLQNKIYRGLVFYEEPFAKGYVHQIIADNMYNVIKNIISTKIDSFQCGAQQRKFIEIIEKAVEMFGQIIGQIIKKYITSL